MCAFCYPLLIPLSRLNQSLDWNLAVLSLSQKYRLIAELWTLSGNPLQGRLAISWPHTATWLCMYQPSLPCTVLSGRRKHGQAGAAACSSKIPRRSACGPGCLVCLGPRHPWVWWELLHRLSLWAARSRAVAAPWALECYWGKREAGSRCSSKASTGYANILYHIRLPGKTGETDVWVFS